MRIDKKLNRLPLTKSKPETLLTLFGSTKVSPMWVADMEFEIAKPIQEALMDRIADSGFGYEYKPESFFRAQKDWYWRNYRVDLIKDHVLYSPTISTTIAVLLENFTNENDGVIVQPPVFMEFREVIRKTKRKAVKNPLRLVENVYEIDFDDLEEKAKSENNKVLILCNPHNPVGRVWHKSELERIVSICKENNLLLISDEVHKDITLFENTFSSVLNFTNDFENVVVATSEAKSFNLCGITDSMAIIPNEVIRRQVSETFSRYNLGRTNALTRVALETAYLKGDNWLERVTKAIEANVLSIEEELQGSKVKLIKPEGTYQVWLDFRSVFKNTKKMFAHLAEQSGIGMNAGHWFGREGALFMRMNIATSNEKVVEAIKKVKEATFDL